MNAAVLRRVLGFLAAMCMTVVPLAAWSTSVFEDFGADFNPADWLFSGDGSTTHDAANGWLVLTPAVGDAEGSAFLTQTVDATKFDASFKFYIGDGSGADGMTFAWVTSPGVGGGGGGMGFFGGALSGYAVKFDTYSGGAPEPENYIAVVDGAEASNTNGFFSNDTIPEMEDTGWFTVEIEFDNGHLQMWMENADAGMARTLVLDGTIPGYTGFDAYFGFTAATGGATNAHLVDDFTLNMAASAPADFRVYGGDTVTLAGNGPSGFTSATWSQVAGEPTVTLTPTGDFEAQFVAPELEIGTILTFRLTVIDPDVGESTADVNVTVTAINPPKVAPGPFRVMPLDLGGGGLGFRVEWEPLVDATQYQIALVLGGQYIWTDTIADTFYEVQGLIEGQDRTIAIRGKNKWPGDGAQSEDITFVAMPNMARTAADGGTRPPLTPVQGVTYKVSHYDIAGMNDLSYTDTNDSWNGAYKDDDFWGYLWGDTYFFDHIVYFTGNMFFDGGWWQNLKVQYTQDGGTTWNDAPILNIVPDMSFTDVRSGKQPFTRFDLIIPTLRGNGVRIYGMPGGTATFTSIAELEVFGDQSRGPLVVQGIDAVYPEGSTAYLDGSLSVSAIGPITSYSWTGPLPITDATSAVASFEAPIVDEDTVYIFSLEASDGTNTATDDDVRITVKNLVTTAVAGPDLKVQEGTEVTLDGSASLTTTGTLTYEWTQTGGTDVGVSGSTDAVVNFTAPILWAYKEELTFQLDVDDGEGGTSADEVVITVRNFLTPSDFVEPVDPANWTFQGSANYNQAAGVLELTPAVNSQVGAAWMNDTIDCTQFFAAFKVYIGDGNGADGMVFGWVEAQAMGDPGGGMGWYGATGPTGYALVFDTYPNPATNLVSFENSEVHPGGDTGGFASYSPPIDLENSGWFDVEAIMDNGHLEVYMANEGAGMPRTLAIDHTLASYTGYAAYFGFAGATGGLNNNHWVDDEIGVFLPSELPDAYASRELPAASYQAGSPVDVGVSLRINPDSVPSSVEVVEQIPAGLSESDVNAPGATVSGGEIRWSLSGTAVENTVLSYSVTPPAGMTQTLGFSGNVSFAATSSNIFGDNTLYPAPTAPRYVEVDMFQDAVLTWSAPVTPGVSGYNVYRSVNGGLWELVASIGGTAYVDTSVVTGENYSYQVAATNVLGDEGPTSRATPQATPLTQAEVEQGREIREAEDFDYGSGQYPGYQDCPAGNEAPSAADLGSEYDYFHPNTGGPSPCVYRTNDCPPDGLGVETVLDDGTTDVYHTNIGWIDVGSWWRYTFNVTEAGWVDVALRIAAPTSGTAAVYWDETLIGETRPFVTGSWHTLKYVRLEDRIETTVGEHVMRVESVGGGWNFDKIAIAWNAEPPKRETVWGDDFEGHTALYDQIGDPWTVISGSNDPPEVPGDQTDTGTWRLWNTGGDDLGAESPALAGMSGNYPIADSDLSGEGVLLNEELISPEVDTTGFSKLRLNFNWHYRIYDDPDHLQVFEADVRVKDSAADPWSDWINLLHLEQGDVDITLDPPQLSGTQVSDLSLYDGKILQLRFHFYDAEYDYWAAVDNVQISGVALPAEIPVLNLSLEADTLTLTWEPFGNNEYTVEHTSDLMAGWTEVASGLTTPTWSTAIPGEATGFYRVGSSQ